MEKPNDTENKETPKQSERELDCPDLAGSEKDYIGLCGKAYQVKNLNGMRVILHDGEWLPATMFVDKMAHAGRWDILCELANAARLLRPDEVEKLLSQNVEHINAEKTTNEKD